MIGGIATFVALILFIVAHEAGHYFAAKATGMKVTEFFLGFGPRIWSFRRGETEYGIKPIPFGAYVKVAGMSYLEDVPEEDLERTYRVKPFWAKTLVVLSGVAANFLIAWILFTGVFLAEGDLVLDGAGEPIPTPVVAGVVEDSPAAAAGLLPGDRLVAVDGAGVEEWADIQAELRSKPGETVTLTIDRDESQLAIPVTLAERVDSESGETTGFLGVGAQWLTEPIGFFDGLGRGGAQVGRGVLFTFETFGRILRFDTIAQLAQGVVGGEVDDEVRPVSIIGVVQLGAQAEDFGVTNFIFVLAVVNVVLGTLNALPLYPLDGGHFAVALYEKITRRQADIRKLVPVAVTVVAIIALIGILAMILDIVNPIDI